MYRNRGEVPDINTDSDNGGYSAPHYSNYWNGRFIIIQYDKTFVAIEVISCAVILLIILALYILAYKVPFEDPIATTKSNFLTGQLITIIMTIVVTGLVTFFTRSSKEKLIANLRIVAGISMIAVLIFLGIKLNIDSKYDEYTFGEFYEQYEQPKNLENKDAKQFSVGLSGIKVSSLKQSYIDESVKAYNNFSIKAISYVIINIAVIGLIVYLSFRLSYIERKKERLSKDDAILYDDEENIKF